MPVGGGIDAEQLLGLRRAVAVAFEGRRLSHRWLLFPQGVLQEEGAKVGDGAAFVFRSAQQGLMNVVAQGDRDPAGLTLKNAKTIVHGFVPLGKAWMGFWCL